MSRLAGLIARFGHTLFFILTLRRDRAFRERCKSLASVTCERDRLDSREPTVTGEGTCECARCDEAARLVLAWIKNIEEEEAGERRFGLRLRG